MSGARLNLVVLRTRDLIRSRALYETFGLRFDEERHGSGTLHLAAHAGGTIVELYPVRDGIEIEAGSTNDLRVEQQSAIRDGTRYAVLVDLDGRMIELSEDAD